MLQRQSLLPRVLVEVQKMSNKDNGQRWILVLSAFGLLILLIGLFLTRTEVGRYILRGPAIACREIALKICGDSGVQEGRWKGLWFYFRCEFICKQQSVPPENYATENGARATLLGESEEFRAPSGKILRHGLLVCRLVRRTSFSGGIPRHFDNQAEK